MRYRNGGTTASVTAFRNRVSNLIVWVDDGTGNWTGSNANIDKAILKGVNVSLAQQLGATTLRASADWQDPRDAKTGEQLARRARGSLKLAADHRLGPGCWAPNGWRPRRAWTTLARWDAWAATAS